jgi:S-DNA-T family DNA segregation ATPase FtsK/SpoIIIE
MERRYTKLKNLGVRNIADYNETVEVSTGQVEKMYYIVKMFDEVGDFMSVAKKEIEDKVMRLAAKSRACGIHLILATQRPTVDVITGTIKANLTSRIAFTVQSGPDSKTILDCNGAESLLGMGDMLFLPNGESDPTRIQCCFVNDKPKNELDRVLAFIKENNPAEFDEEIEHQMFTKDDGFDSGHSGNGVEDAFDPLMKDCLRYVIKAKKCSVSSLQGYFGIGYPKANKIVLQMEKAGFVSPAEGASSKRVIYITQQEFEERFGEDLD